MSVLPDNPPQAEPLVVQGRVVELLPNGLCTVSIEGRGASGTLTAHCSPRAATLRLRPGDLVSVEVAPYDATRARIVRKGASKGPK